MASIAELSEGFEAGVAGAQLSTGTTIFNTITGTGTAATFVNTAVYAGAMAMNMVATGGVVKTYRSDFATQSSAWYGFAIKLDTLPSVIATVYQVYQGTTVAFSVRVNTDGTVQLRDGTTTRFTSSALVTGSWYWVSVKFTPGNATGARLKIYDATSVLQYDSTDGAATATTATAMDNVRVGYLAGTGDLTFNIDRLEADTASEIAPLVASGGSTEITALREDFENGNTGDALSVANSIFTTITGTGNATFIDNAYADDNAIQMAVTGGTVKTYRVDYTSQTEAWYGFALRVDALPTALTTVYQVYQGTTLAFGVRINTDGTLQLRDGTVLRFTSTALTVTEWYWVSVHFKPGDAAGARLKVYNRAATSVYDSGGGAATSTTATAMDNLRIGYLAGTGDATFSMDRLRADTTTEIAALPDGSSTLSVNVVSSPSSPEADDVVTLTATATGATGPYTYSWSQVSGTAVSLSGSGTTRTFTAPALIDAETLTFRCDVTPTAGAASYDLAEVPILPHNFWTMHGGTLVPRRIYTKVSGSLVTTSH